MAKGNRGPFFDLAQQGRKSKTGDFLKHVAWIYGRRIQHMLFSEKHPPAIQAQPLHFGCVSLVIFAKA